MLLPTADHRGGRGDLRWSWRDPRYGVISASPSQACDRIPTRVGLSARHACAILPD
jgi:hypothetical protein